MTADETVAFALRQDTEAERRFAFWTCGIALYLSWNAATVAGTVLGTMIQNTGSFGLDATFPAMMLALALPAVTSRRTAAAAGTGAAAAVAAPPSAPKCAFGLAI